MCHAATVLYIALWIEPSLHPSSDRTYLDLKLEMPHQMVAAPELIVMGDMPGGRAAERPKGRARRRARG
eukprot:1901540-Pyramimonas_sp.AAC.1